MYCVVIRRERNKQQINDDNARVTDP